MLLDSRNRNWVEIISMNTASIPMFIAVGAGHLGGPNGLIALLRKAGYTLTPIHIH